MQRIPKRSHHLLTNNSKQQHKKKLKNSNNHHAEDGEPYPDHPRPRFEECLSVRDSLLALHGFPQEFAKYRETRSHLGISSNTSEADHIIKEEDVGVQEETVLDGLVSTLLSQNTTDANSKRAFASLKAAFPTWEHVSFYF